MRAADTRSARSARGSSLREPAASKTVTRIPRPSAPPRWWATLTRPPATAASRGCTPAMPPVVRLLSPRPLADAEDDHRHGDAEHVAGVDRDAAHPRRAEEHGGTAADGQRVVADPCGRARGDRSGGERGPGDGQERQTGLQRAEAADPLEVLRHEEEEADQHGVEQKTRGVGARAPAVREQPQGHQRLLCARLIGDEERQQRHAGRQRRDGRSGGPPGVGGVHDPEHQRSGPERGTQRAGHVEPGGVALGLCQHARGGQDRRQPDGHVEKEAPAPRQRAGQHTAGDQAERRADAGQRAVGRHRARPLRALGKARRQQRQRRRRQRRGSDPLHRSGGDHPARRLRQADQQRRDGEQPDAQHERPPSAEQVAGTRSEQQQAAERQRVGVLRPGQARGREAEVAMDGRQRRHQDRDVEQNQQVAGEDHREHHAALLGRAAHPRSSSSAGTRRSVVARACSEVIGST